MNFNSLEFLIFFPSIVLIYYIFPARYRALILLLSSYIFYMSWRVEYIALIIISTVTDYYCGIYIDRNHLHVKRKKYFLFCSLFINLSLLALFKYYNFFVDNFNYFYGESRLSSLSILLPVGISFYTFQTIGYTIDVYKGRIKPELNIIRFAVYVSYFPQLVAGPIERAKSLLPQFSSSRNIFSRDIEHGARIIIWGLFKKMVVADNLAKCVGLIYSVHDASSFEYLIATYFFAFQIYLDFSGYTDIAIGVSRIFGIKLRRNFRTPYFSLSMKEFWTRWHISLSTWFRDYLYIPLGGSKGSESRMYINLITTFAISGLWHGANWTFLIWGLYNGLLLSIEKKLKVIVKKSRISVALFFKYFLFFNVVCIGWIFFRANNISDALTILHAFTKLSSTLNYLSNSVTEVFIGLIGIVIVLIIDYRFELEKWRLRNFLKLSILSRYLLIYLAILMILIFSATSPSNFIYFQF